MNRIKTTSHIFLPACLICSVSSTALAGPSQAADHDFAWHLNSPLPENQPSPFVVAQN